MYRFPLIFQDCVPEKFWLLSRHGAAYPSKSIMDGFVELETVSKSYSKGINKNKCFFLQLLEAIKTSPSSPDICDTLESWTLTNHDTYEELSEKV